MGRYCSLQLRNPAIEGRRLELGALLFFVICICIGGLLVRVFVHLGVVVWLVLLCTYWMSEIGATYEGHVCGLVVVLFGGQDELCVRCAGFANGLVR
jgi:hypothetical protein